MNNRLVTVAGAPLSAGARDTETTRHAGSPHPAGPQGSAPAIEIRALTKTFRTGDGMVRAVDGIDLAIGRGEVVALLGHNGAGKTTTLDMVLGFTAPTSGECRVFGRKPQAAVRAGLVGGMLQTDALLDDLTAAQTVAMIATQHTNPIPVADALERAGATHIAKRRVSKCSGGEQQRLRFASPCSPTPNCSCSTNPPPAWTSPPAANSGPPCTARPGAAARSCSPPTTSPRRRSSPTAPS